MRFYLVSIFSLWFFPALIWGQSVDRLIEQENARFYAMIHSDTATLHRLLADELVYIHSNGLQESKAGHIRAIATKKISYNVMKREGAPTLRQFGKMAITNGQVMVMGLLGEDPFILRLVYTAVYRYKKKQWQLLSWQSTRLPDTGK
jgi:hypothetical protein